MARATITTNETETSSETFNTMKFLDVIGKPTETTYSTEAPSSETFVDDIKAVLLFESSSENESKIQNTMVKKKQQTTKNKDPFETIQDDIIAYEKALENCEAIKAWHAEEV